MVKWGIVADVHGNLEALEAALGELERRGVERIACLGDLVGYNADPDGVVERLERARALSICGNHDLIALGSMGFDRCWYQAAHALARTRERLGRRARRYLETLPHHASLGERILLVHGDLDDPQRYLRTPKDIAESAARVRVRYPRARVVLHGHTHERRVYRVRGAAIDRVQLTPTIWLDVPDGELLYVNPGSIDAQRKPEGARRAELAIYDSARETIDLVSVPYDDEVTERRARGDGYRMSAASKLAHETGRALARVPRWLLR